MVEVQIEPNLYIKGGINIVNNMTSYNNCRSLIAKVFKCTIEAKLIA